MCDFPPLFSFPNLAVGVLTRESVRKALNVGISAKQIIQYLRSNAHGEMLSQVDCAPVIIFRPHFSHIWRSFRLLSSQLLFAINFSCGSWRESGCLSRKECSTHSFCQTLTLALSATTRRFDCTNHSYCTCTVAVGCLTCCLSCLDDRRSFVGQSGKAHVGRQFRRTWGRPQILEGSEEMIEPMTFLKLFSKKCFVFELNLLSTLFCPLLLIAHRFGGFPFCLILRTTRKTFT